ncbi:hypothetical protein BJY01DRAFT_261246 [Aspergillus pseudoustus]|uniref:Zn(2)-C6 fungal-type domain-containing protein n=1 Tax=Aspergillus pseudoustus TaxID=1810923 RepID=A0ABR4KFI7_9EURO
MPSRRSHPKSHHGCDQCKLRRIKCDEVHPVCGSCRRKNLACVFHSVGPFPAPDPPALATGPIIQHDRASLLPLQHLELMHHWHTSIVESLSDAKPLQDVIRVAMPQEGLRSPFLMHSVLAVAAVNLAQSTTAGCRQRYIEAAMTHHNESLTLCAPFVNNITRQNCHALFAFSCLLPVFVFASQTPQLSPRLQSLSDVIETLKLIRGSASVVDQAKPWIEEGPMHPLLRVGKFHHSSEIKKCHARSLSAKLEALARDLSVSSRAGKSSAASQTPCEALQQLQHLLGIFINTGDPRAVMAWPVVVDASYFDLLLQKQRLAVLTFGLFGSALEILSGRWWLEGTGPRFVALAVDDLSPPDREILSSSSLQLDHNS